MTNPEVSVAELFEAAKSGDKRALGRALTVIEQNDEQSDALDRLVLQNSYGGFVIGVTGAPGAGKSSLVDHLISQARSMGKVAVIAVDPSSPFSGGAILGDRVRMSSHESDDGVFIRSLASRGALGGLSISTRQAIRLFLSCGYQYVLVETVGVGQIELDIARAADLVIVVMTPNSGDDVQSSKAGILEIADVFVVNKSDLPGAETVVKNLSYELEVSQLTTKPPIVKTSSLNNQGIDELWEAIRTIESSVSADELLNGRVAQRKDEIVLRATAKLEAIVRENVDEGTVSITTDPISAADDVVEKIVRN